MNANPNPNSDLVTLTQLFSIYKCTFVDACSFNMVTMVTAVHYALHQEDPLQQNDAF